MSIRGCSNGVDVVIAVSFGPAPADSTLVLLAQGRRRQPAGAFKPLSRMIAGHAAAWSASGAGGALRAASTPPSIGMVVPVIQHARSLA
jgi:hypothetical protein